MDPVNKDDIGKIDVLIVTAVKDECDAVLLVTEGAVPGSRWEECDSPVKLELYIREFLTREATIRIAVTRAFAMGRENAVIAAAPLLAAHPEIRCLAMCGACAGRRGDVNLGDVIIADRSWPYDFGKDRVTIDQEGRRIEQFQGDIELYRLQPLDWKQKAERFAPDPNAAWLAERPRSYESQGNWLLERLANAEDPRRHPARKERCPNYPEVLQQLWKVKLVVDGGLDLTEAGQQRIDRLLNLHPDGVPEIEPSFKVVVGPIASGAPVVEDPTIFDRLSAGGMRKVVGLEMESSAILTFASLQGVEAAVVAKGVMDHADPFKSDNMKAFADRAAAECLVGFIRANLPAAPRAAHLAASSDANRRAATDIPPSLERSRQQEQLLELAAALPLRWKTSLAPHSAAAACQQLEAIVSVIIHFVRLLKPLFPMKGFHTELVDFGRYVGWCAIGVGDTWWSKDNLLRASQSYGLAENVFRPIRRYLHSVTDPKADLMEFDFVILLNRMGLITASRGDRNRALQIFQQAYQIDQLRVAVNRTEGVGILAKERRTVGEAVSDADPNSEDWRRELYIIMIRLAEEYLYRNLAKDAREMLLRSLVLVQKSVDQYPTDEALQHDLSVVLERLGDSELRCGTLPSALSVFERSRGIRKELTTTDSFSDAQWREDLQRVCRKIDETWLALIRLSPANRTLSHIVSTIQRVESMSNPKYADDLLQMASTYAKGAVMQLETVIIVVGTTIPAELLDRPVAELLRDEIDKRGGGARFHRALVIADSTWYADGELAANPVISLGCPTQNRLSAELDHRAETEDESGRRTMAGEESLTLVYRKNSVGLPQTGLWGSSAQGTREAMRRYALEEKGFYGFRVQRFLEMAWSRSK